MPPTRQSQLLPSPFPYRYFLDLCFRPNSDIRPPKSPALENIRLYVRRCVFAVTGNSTLNYRERTIVFFSEEKLTGWGNCLFLVRLMGACSSISMRSDSTRQTSKYRRFIVGGLNNRIDKSDDRLGDQSRCGNSRGYIPARLYRSKARIDS